VAAEIQCVLKQPFVVAGHLLNISSRLGIALYPAHETDEMHWPHADDATYRAKARPQDLPSPTA
jgi:GGDEF domain-containing protein